MFFSAWEHPYVTLCLYDLPIDCWLSTIHTIRLTRCHSSKTLQSPLSMVTHMGLMQWYHGEGMHPKRLANWCVLIQSVFVLALLALSQIQVHVIHWLWVSLEPSQLRQPVHHPWKHHLVLCSLPKCGLLGDHHPCHPVHLPLYNHLHHLHLPLCHHHLPLCQPTSPVCGCSGPCPSDAFLLDWVHTVKEPLPNSSTIVGGVTPCHHHSHVPINYHYIARWPRVTSQGTFPSLSLSSISSTGFTRWQKCHGIFRWRK